MARPNPYPLPFTTGTSPSTVCGDRIDVGLPRGALNGESQSHDAQTVLLGAPEVAAPARFRAAFDVLRPDAGPAVSNASTRTLRLTSCAPIRGLRRQTGIPGATTSTGSFPRPIRELRRQGAEAALFDQRRSTRRSRRPRRRRVATRRTARRCRRAALAEPIEQWRNRTPQPNSGSAKSAHEHRRDQRHRPPHAGDGAGHLPAGVEVAEPGEPNGFLLRECRASLRRRATMVPTATTDTARSVGGATPVPTPLRSIRSFATERPRRDACDRALPPIDRRLMRWRTHADERRPRSMVNGAGGLVPAAVAGLDQPPHHVDVFARTQRFVEAADRAQRVGANDQRRGGHVADASSRSDAGRLGRRGPAATCTDSYSPMHRRARRSSGLVARRVRPVDRRSGAAARPASCRRCRRRCRRTQRAASSLRRGRRCALRRDRDWSAGGSSAVLRSRQWRARCRRRRRSRRRHVGSRPARRRMPAPRS